MLFITFISASVLLYIAAAAAAAAEYCILVSYSVIDSKMDERRLVLEL